MTASVVRWLMARALYHRYRRPAMAMADLYLERDRGRPLYPSIRRVKASATIDSVLVRALPGQTAEHFERAAAVLAHCYQASSCAVREDRPGYVWLDFTP